MKCPLHDVEMVKGVMPAGYAANRKTGKRCPVCLEEVRADVRRALKRNPYRAGQPKLFDGLRPRFVAWPRA